MIELININKKYGDNIIFDNYNLKIETNSFTVIYGPSGCGKSTLLNIIGLFDYFSGHVKLFGKTYSSNSKQSRSLYKNRIGYIMQNFGLVSDISVYENMKIVCNDIERIKEVLSEYGIGDKLKNSIYTLSGGEQQRVAIAMIELKNPDIILADEPTGNLDDENRDFIIGKFNDFQSKGKTIVIVTHDEEFLKHASQKIFL